MENAPLFDLIYSKPAKNTLKIANKIVNCVPKFYFKDIIDSNSWNICLIEY